MSNTLRNVVRKNLSTKFSANESKKIETKLFTMCQTSYTSNSNTLYNNSRIQPHEDKVNLLHGSESNFNDYYKKIAYEKVAETMMHVERINDILKDIANNVTGWGSCIYLNFRENEKRDTTDQTESMKVSKGEFRCKIKTCRSDECYHFTIQTRSCDEGGTTYVVCSKCRGMYTIT
jgi:DNA-directed RNA polymerase subunit M/transcription elongation factor TFIIS